MNEGDYYTTEQLMLNKISECSAALKNLAAAMDETTRTLKELVLLLTAESDK
ncbi:MAG: hypothetical protein J7577_13475 [Sphingobacteriaceae bacterium]|nr:hypothetical protein [Sphingobacteriaceae bacterium]